MPQFKKIKGGITAPKGFKASGMHCGVKFSGKKDIALIFSQVPAAAAGTFTTNKCKAAPIIVSMEHVRTGKAQAIIANAGCANACTGDEGLADSKTMARATASTLNIREELVLVASTGSIGSRLPMKNILNGIRMLSKRLSVHGADDAATAILTTDLVKKEVAVQLKVGGKTVKIAGIAKGSGMIAPNMATMFAFITTDAAVSSVALKDYLKGSVEKSFNMTVVDKETSTNDCVFLLANGLAGNNPIHGKDEADFKHALDHICITLAKAIARDGEGATKLIEVKVTGANTLKDAKSMAKSVAGSDLLKAAIYGEDPNYGRIMAAAGYSGANFKPEQTNVFIGNTQVVKNGKGMTFNAKAAHKYLKGKDVQITIMLGQGAYMAVAWGCDLTYDYVKINAKYHT